MSAYAPPTRDRLPAAIVAVAIPAAVLWMLMAGPSVQLGAPGRDALDIFTPAPPAPQVKRIKSHAARARRREGQASPPNLRSRAAEIAAPAPFVPAPSPVIAAPVPLAGWDASSGSAPVVGPGTGAGGIGNGLGSGDGGNGDGGGGDGAGGGETPPRWRSGRIRDGDFPDALRAIGGGVVGVRYTVLTSGRVGGCRITHSSGIRLLDETTCHLIVERFRFRPSLDAAGRPVQADIVESHEWVNEGVADEPAEPGPPARRRW